MVRCSQHYSCGRVVMDTGSCTYKIMKRFLRDKNDWCRLTPLYPNMIVITQSCLISYLHWLTLTPPLCISNGINYTCGMKLFIKSQTSIVQPLKFGNGYVISTPLYRLCNDLSMQRLKLIHVSKSGPGDQKRTVTDIIHMIHFVKKHHTNKRKIRVKWYERKIRKTNGT